MSTSIVLGSNDSTVITPSHMRTTVRGGGAAGSSAWLARVTGPDARWGIARQFVRKDLSGLSGSGRSGSITWDIDGDGIYEYAGVSVSSSRCTRGFFRVTGDDVEEMTRAQVLAEINAGATA